MFAFFFSTTPNERVICTAHLFHYFFFALQEVEQLRQEKLDIDLQVRAIQGTQMGSMQNFPVQRRSDRGYSSDMESMRPSRGGPRGRGRGGRGGDRRDGNGRFHPGNNLHNSNGNEPNSYNNVSSNDPPSKAKFSSRGRGGNGGRLTRGNGSSNDRRPVARPAISTTPK